VEFRILGPLDALDDTGPIDLTGGKQKALLALLLLQAGHVLPVDRIVDDLWGDEVPESARKMVQIFVSQLRKQLPVGLIQTHPSGYRGALDGHALDLHRFDALHARGRDASAAGDAEAAASALREALELWRGTPLAEFQEPFAEQEAARLVEQQLACRELRIDADLELGRHGDLVGELDILVRRHPLRERFRGQQMIALYRCGRHAEALESFQLLRRTLRDELGIEPSAQLKDLERLVLQQDPSLDLRRDQPVVAQQPTSPAADAPVPESRRTVTVVVADLSPGDTPKDPEARRALTQARLQDARRALSHHGASIVPLGAARLLGVFGVPIAQDDDALRAVAAAVELRAQSPRVRVGVSTGVVVTGDPLVAGAPVDEATLLQERATAGEVLSGSRTWRAVRHAAVAEERDGVWSINSVDAEATPVPRRFETPLVGRGEELGDVVGAFERAAAKRQPHLVTVFGAPGLGKTRLGIECAERLRAGATAVIARCRAGEEATYAPLRELIEALAEGEPAAWTQRRLGDEVGARLAHQLNAATGLAAGPAHAEDVALATRRLLTGLARKRPLLLVIEDVHWAAPAFLDLVESLIELVQAPMLVLCLARPDLLDTRPLWGGGRVSSSTIMLDSLSPSESGELLDRLAPQGDFDADRRERILALAEGNPLFIEQLLAAAVEGEDMLPDSIHTLIAARLDRLDEHSRAVVQSASVLGSSFNSEDLAGLVEADVAASLVTLARRELIRPGEADDPGDAGWSFRHSLIRDVAYASIPKRRRAELHESVAARSGDGDAFAAFHLDQALRALLEAGAEGPEVEQLRAQAGERLRRAGLAAAERADYDAAVSQLKRANELLRNDAPERIAFAPGLAQMLVWTEGGAAARTLLEEARDAAAAIGDARLTARIKIAMGSTMMWTDDAVSPEQMLRDIGDTVGVLERESDHEGLALAELLRFHALDQAGLPNPEARLPIALAYARRAHAPQVEELIMGWICITLPHGSVPVRAAIARIEDIRRASPSAYVHASALGALGLLRAAQGEFEEGRALVLQTRRALEELGQRQAAAAHSIAIGEVELMAGDAAAAERVWRKGYEGVTAIADQHSAANVAWRLGLALARQGKDDEAERFALIARAAHPRGLWVDVWWRVVLALVAAHRGNAELTVVLVAEARERVASAHASESAMEVDALLDSAAALRAAGRPDEAAALVADAAGIAERLGYVIALRRAEAAQRAATT
jgi:DNA-binding SARP family transcriptional activator